jgi:hypothetical protein
MAHSNRLIASFVLSGGWDMRRRSEGPSRLWLALWMGAASHAGLAADVTVAPPPGAGFAVRDAANSSDRLRVNEAGAC